MGKTIRMVSSIDKRFILIEFKDITDEFIEDLVKFVVLEFNHGEVDRWELVGVRRLGVGHVGVYGFVKQSAYELKTKIIYMCNGFYKGWHFKNS